jgi:hypothetical protein
MIVSTVVATLATSSPWAYWIVLTGQVICEKHLDVTDHMAFKRRNPCRLPRTAAQTSTVAADPNGVSRSA